MLIYIILTAASIYTIYLLAKMVKGIMAERKSCTNESMGLVVYRRMFYGGVIGSILAYAILALIQPDLYWAIFNPKKVSTVTQGMLSRSFYILTCALASIFIGGIPCAVIGLMSRKWKSIQPNEQKPK